MVCLVERLNLYWLALGCHRVVQRCKTNLIVRRVVHVSDSFFPISAIWTVFCQEQII